MTSLAYSEVIAGSQDCILLSGISELVLAAIIISGWPMTAGSAPDLLVDINLITWGWAIVMTALAARSFAQPIGALAAARH